MGIYILNFLFLVYIFLISKFFRFKNGIKIATFSVVIFWLTIFIGLRHEVGGDWFAYLAHYENLSLSLDLEEIFLWDPLYVLIEYIAKKFSLGIYGVNTICALLFLIGLSFFIKTFKLDFILSYIIAYPYLIMVVANGYTRQATALGMVFLFYVFLYKKRYLKALLFFLLATLFHKSAIISAFVGIGFIRVTKITYKVIVFLILLLLFSFLTIYIFRDTIYWMYVNYLLERMHSHGAYYRILINIFASIFLIVFSKRWASLYEDFELWKPFIYFSFLMLVLGLVLNVTTIVDRLLLYFYPLQLVVFGRLHSLIVSKPMKYASFLFVLFFYFTVLIVWLKFAVHRHAWIPYDNLMFKLF